MVPLLFGGVIFAIALHARASRLARLTPLSQPWALAAVVVGVLVVFALLSWLLGGRIVAQFATLRTTLPAAITTATDWLHGSTVGLAVLGLYDSLKEGGVPWSRVAMFTTAAVSGIANVLLMLVLGLYLAAAPALYYRGFLQLTPKRAPEGR